MLQSCIRLSSSPCNVMNFGKTVRPKANVTIVIVTTHRPRRRLVAGLITPEHCRLLVMYRVLILNELNTKNSVIAPKY